MPYSQVNQPPGTFWAAIHPGILSSKLAAPMTLVLPHAIKQEPLGCLRKSQVILTGRS
jgi:hypothetical protein